MKTPTVFKKMRGINDAQLGLVLTNHADVLRGVGLAVTMLLRERRLLLVLVFVQAAALVWTLVRS